MAPNGVCWGGDSQEEVGSTAQFPQGFPESWGLGKAGEGHVTAGKGDVVPQCAWGMRTAMTVYHTSSLQRHYDFKRFLSDA